MADQKQNGNGHTTLRREYVINRLGKEFVLYAGLVDVAHQEGLKRITVTLLQVPSDENGNVAISAAEVETSRGVFSDIGDASYGNVSKNIAPHIIRMSSTRAKARALRDATNITMTALEELGGPDSDDTSHGDGMSWEPPLRRVDESGESKEAVREGPKASPNKPASANQLATITKLSRLVGIEDAGSATMSSADASEQITELSRLYNEKKGQGFRQTS